MASSLIRLDGWEARLAGAANQRRSLPYRYGTNDCCSFARACIEAVTGTVLLPEIEAPRGWLAVARVMIARGWESVEDLMGEVIGPAIAPDLSRPGDIVSYEQGGEFHLAVRIGDAALTPSMTGLTVIDSSLWRHAWNVG